VSAGAGRIRLIHWNAVEARERAARLRGLGYTVNYAVPVGLGFMKELRRRPPAAVLIDLGRLPSQGRDVGLALRASAGTRPIPLVFVGGDPQKVTGVRRVLPDAVFTTWERLRGTLPQAIAHPPAAPLVPRSLFDAYAGRPLAVKLGIKPGSVIALAGAPSAFRTLLQPLPAGVIVRARPRGGEDVVVWFVRAAEELQRDIGSRAGRVGRGTLWIAWPKQASGVTTDVTQQEVRRIGLAAGLVDYKIAAIDATWSGLAFTRRK
jgi:hypothetical protein